MGQWDIRAAVVRACKAAALTITKIGAQDGIPWRDEIDNFEEEAISKRLSRINVEDTSEVATDEEL